MIIQNIKYYWMSFTKLFFLLFCFSSLILCSESSKQSNIKIEGDWYLNNNTIVDKFDYQEIFFDKKVFYIFQPSNYGINYAENYKFNGQNFYLLDSIAKDTLKEFSVKMSGNKLKLISVKGFIEYGRIENGNRLSQYIKKKITKEQFENDFTKRMIQSGKGNQFIPPNYEGESN